MQRLSDLEQQLQHEKEKNEALLPLQERNDDVNSLMKNIKGLTSQQEKLHAALSEKVNLLIANGNLKVCRKKYLSIT